MENCKQLPSSDVEIKRIWNNVMRMQHQLEACASDVGDSSHVTCLLG